MLAMTARKNWATALAPLVRKYARKKHPLKYRNNYQLLVMVVLSARSTDDHINNIAPDFFKVYKDMHFLSLADARDLYPLLRGVTNFAHKADWLVRIAQQVKTNRGIPMEMEQLTELPGIGRKSARMAQRPVP